MVVVILSNNGKDSNAKSTYNGLGREKNAITNIWWEETHRPRMTVHAKYKFASLRKKKTRRSWSDIYRAQVDWLLAGNLPCLPLSFAHNPLTSKNKISSWTSPCYWLKANWNLTTKINSIKCFNLITKGNHRKLSRSTENLYTVSSMLTPEACKSFFFFLMQILNSTTEFFS